MDGQLIVCLVIVFVLWIPRVPLTRKNNKKYKNKQFIFSNDVYRMVSEKYDYNIDDT